MSNLLKLRTSKASFCPHLPNENSYLAISQLNRLRSRLVLSPPSFSGCFQCKNHLSTLEDIEFSRRSALNRSLLTNDHVCLWCPAHFAQSTYLHTPLQHLTRSIFFPTSLKFCVSTGTFTRHDHILTLSLNTKRSIIISPSPTNSLRETRPISISETVDHTRLELSSLSRFPSQTPTLSRVSRLSEHSLLHCQQKEMRFFSPALSSHFSRIFSSLHCPHRLAIPCITQMLLNIFSLYDSRPCLGSVFGSTTDNQLVKWLTFGNVFDRLITTARFFREKIGLETGERVGIMLNNSSSFYIFDWACMISGLVSVPIDPRTGADNLNAILTSLHISALISAESQTFESLQSPLSHLILQIDENESKPSPKNHSIFAKSNVYCFDPLLSHFLGPSQHSPIIYRSPDDLLTITLTSGTSGSLPKGVFFANSQICNQ